MSARDRLVVAVIAALVVAGGMWLLLVSPERAKVTSLNSQIATQRTALDTAQAQIASARRATIDYVDHLQQVDEVIRAVPQTPGEAEVVATIDKLAGTKVDFRMLNLATAGASAGGPVSLGLTFSFWATYQGLQSFLASLDSLTATDGSRVKASGRLFTVSAVSLSPLDNPKAPPNVTVATVTAQTYMQASAAAITGATSPTGVTSPTGATTPTGAVG